MKCKMCVFVFLGVVGIIVLLLLLNKKEHLLQPWQLEHCYQLCYKKFDTNDTPWFGGERTDWLNKLQGSPESQDVAGCLSQCHQATWNPPLADIISFS